MEAGESGYWCAVSGVHLNWAEAGTMSDAEKGPSDAAPSLLVALAAIEERLKAGQAEMEKKQQERQDTLCHAVLERRAEAVLSG